MTESLTCNDTTWINANVLTEVMYCPRAGLIAHEEQNEDRGAELDRAPRLDYLPDFSMELIEAALERTWNSIWRALTWTPPAVLVVGLASYFMDRRWALVLIPIGFFGVRWLVGRLRIVTELSRRLRAARDAVPGGPHTYSTEMQPVNWWSVLKAGFVCIEYDSAHHDPDLCFSGRPWRVLHKGSLRIPVFRKRAGKATVHPQHIARMAAYCHLLEVCEGGSSPYGIVLFAGSYEGMTVPSTEENRALFQEKLIAARELIESIEKGGQTPAAPKPSVCESCPLGWPRVYIKGKTDTHLCGQRLRPFRTRGADQRLYHSRCGDRFRWVPPHARAAEKGLR